MSNLETAFYIIGIIFMVASLLTLVGLVTAVLVIRNKIVSLERLVQQKAHSITDNVSKVVEIATAVEQAAQKLRRK